MLKKVDGTQFLQLWVMSIMKWPQQLGSWTFCPQPATMKQKKIKSIIEWASAQVPPTPLYLGGTVGRERERGEGEREREERERWMDG